MGNTLYAIAAVLIVLWLIGFLFRFIISPVIHLLLVVALIVLAYRFFIGRRMV